ncbi:MAG: glycosyltransferase [Proteobacteria bacterium]|nr:glycosyltransferase [Pseudomonadota bacterium]
MNLLFATAEFAPLVRVGGLAEATAGLVRELRTQGVDVDVVLPDYFRTPLTNEKVLDIDVPNWVGGATARTGTAADGSRVTLVSVPGIDKPHPYVDEDGQGWPDNPDRFFAFSAALAGLAKHRRPDVIHLNDWHTALTLGFLDGSLPSVLTIHTLGYQGWTSGGWLDRIPFRSELFERHGGTNPMAGAIVLADRVIAVSPTYADEIRRPETGAGLHDLLAARGADLVGIRNGIDRATWDPKTDRGIAARFSADDLAGKATCRSDLLRAVDWPDDEGPIVGVVSRLVEQKGIEFILDTLRFAETLPIRMILLGSGDRWIAEELARIAEQQPDVLVFRNGYDPSFGHKIFAGSDLFLMPSRFEPCGLAQMQAMAYGTIPIVTSVGGLRDTVIDADRSPTLGTGFMSEFVDTGGVVDAVHRSVRTWNDQARRRVIQRNGMSTDWSWTPPAKTHIDLYGEVVDRGQQMSDGRSLR